MDKLRENGIDSRPIFYPMSHMPAFLSYINSSVLKNSISISERGLSLPSSAILEVDEIRFICNKLVKIVDNFDD